MQPLQPQLSATPHCADSFVSFRSLRPSSDPEQEGMAERSKRGRKRGRGWACSLPSGTEFSSMRPAFHSVTSCPLSPCGFFRHFSFFAAIFRSRTGGNGRKKRKRTKKREGLGLQFAERD